MLFKIKNEFQQRLLKDERRRRRSESFNAECWNEFFILEKHKKDRCVWCFNDLFHCARIWNATNFTIRFLKLEWLGRFNNCKWQQIQAIVTPLLTSVNGLYLMPVFSITTNFPLNSEFFKNAYFMHKTIVLSAVNLGKVL